MSNYTSRFNKETAQGGHNNTVLSQKVLPEGVQAPFGDAWGYLEGKSMMEVHSHPTEEIYMVFSGKGICHVGDERFEAVPGDVIRIPANVMHTMECGEGESILWAALWW